MASLGIFLPILDMRKDSMFLSDELQGSASFSGTVPETGSIIPVTEKLESGNEASMVLAVQYGQFDMLLTGDVEGGGENQLTKQLEESYSEREFLLYR